MRWPAAAMLLLANVMLAGEKYPTRFSSKIATHPKVVKALRLVDQREEPLVAEWIHITEIAAPSGQEADRARYVKSQLEKMKLSNVRIDEAGNVSGVRKGKVSGAGIVFAAHLDTVFPASTPLKVQRDGQTLKCPGIGDNSGNVAALLELFRALDEAGIETQNDLIFLATTQEETRLHGMRHWLGRQDPKPEMVVATDIPLGMVWYGALRLAAMQFVYTSTGSHTLLSRGEPNPVRAVARAVQSIYDIPLPEPDPAALPMKLPVINIGKIQGGSVINAIPREASFTVDLRSLDNNTQDRLSTAVVNAAQAAASAEGVGFRVVKPEGDDLDYSKAMTRAERRGHPMVQTALDVQKYLQLVSAPEPFDVGSTDANVGVSMGIPSIAVGAIRSRDAHMVTESADVKSIVPGTRSLLLLAVALAGLAAN